METIKQLTKKIFTYAGIGAVLLSILFFLFFKSDAKALTLGLLFGVLISALNFIDLGNTMQRAVSKQPAQAQSYTIKKYFMRFIINGVVIYVAVTSPHLHIIGTVLGMLLIKIAIMMTNLFNDKQFYKNILKRKEV